MRAVMDLLVVALACCAGARGAEEGEGEGRAQRVRRRCWRRQQRRDGAQSTAAPPWTTALGMAVIWVRTGRTGGRRGVVGGQ